MVLPIVIGILGLGGVVGVGITAACYSAWKSTTIALLGARGAGKTTLCKFLTEGEVPTNPRQTTNTRKHEVTNFPIDDLDLKISEVEDLPGDKSQYAEWKRASSDNSTIFYLFRVDLILSGDEKHIIRTVNDVKHLGEWIDPTKKKLVLIGTHCDKIPHAYSDGDEITSEIIDKVHNNIHIKKIISHAGESKKPKIYLGSLKNLQSCETLVKTIFEKSQ